MKKDLIKIIKISTLGLLLSSNFAFGWTAPITLPPTANQDLDVSSVPITQGVINTSQLKEGGLAVGPLTVTGTTNFYGHVSIYLCTTCGSGGSQGMKPSNNIFAGLSLDKITKPINDFFASLLKVNIAYAIQYGPPQGPDIDFVYPQSTSDVLINYPNGNTDCPIGNYVSGTDEWVCSTSAYNPKFKIKSFVGGGLTVSNGCSSSATSIPASTNNSPVTTEITLNHLYSGDYGDPNPVSRGYSCKVTLTNNSSQLPSTTIYLNFAVTGSANKLPAPLPGGNLYVSGKIGIGTTAPTEKLDVVGSVKIGAFEDPDESAINHLCSDTLGKIVFCPKGYQPFSGNEGNDPSLPLGYFNVPDGVFKINVSGRNIYVSPGQQIPIFFEFISVTGGTTSFGTYSFGTYFSLVGMGIYVSY
ncbi:MAG: hypothetical protein WAV23_03415 [Minisyncoccia bacterium]